MSNQHSHSPTASSINHSNATSSPTTTPTTSLTYHKKGGKLFFCTRGAQSKCIAKLKRRKLNIKTSSTNSSEYQLTPFTTVQQQTVHKPPSSSFVILTLSELLSVVGEKKSDTVQTVQLLVPTVAEAEDWVSALQNNINVVIQHLFESKWNPAFATNSLTQSTLKQFPNKRSNSDSSPTLTPTTSACWSHQGGYVIRKNHISSIYYLKPSIVYIRSATAVSSNVVNSTATATTVSSNVVATNSSNSNSSSSGPSGQQQQQQQIIFYKSHDSTQIADVIACRVSCNDEHVIMKEVEGSPLSIALLVDNQIKEVFVLSDASHKKWWMDHLRQSLRISSDAMVDERGAGSTTAAIDKSHTTINQQEDSNTRKQVDEQQNKKDQEEAQVVQHEQEEVAEEEDDDSSYPMGTMVIHDYPGEYSSETMVIHDSGTMVIHGEDDEYQDGSVRVYGTTNGGMWEEPNLFGKSRNNIFQSSFWNEPLDEHAHHQRTQDDEEYGTMRHNSDTVTFTRDDFYGAIEEMREKMAEMESECLSLRIQLGNRDELIEKLQLENQKLKAQLGID